MAGIRAVCKKQTWAGDYCEPVFWRAEHLDTLSPMNESIHQGNSPSLKMRYRSRQQPTTTHLAHAPKVPLTRHHCWAHWHTNSVPMGGVPGLNQWVLGCDDFQCWSQRCYRVLWTGTGFYRHQCHTRGNLRNELGEYERTNPEKQHKIDERFYLRTEIIT